MKSLVIIPTYNEAENISDIIDAVLKQDKSIDILVVDDNSPDGTADIVKHKPQFNKRIFLMCRSGKQGLGSAYVAGFKYAIKHKYDYIFEMDADFSHNPDVIPKMLKEIKKFDLVIGSRYKEGINVVNWPLRRLLLSYLASKYVNFVTGMPVKDPTGGFKCFRRKVLEAIDLDKIISDGYSFQIEMNFRTWQNGFIIEEIPIIFKDRISGESKLSRRIIWEAVFIVWKLKYRQIRKLL